MSATLTMRSRTMLVLAAALPAIALVVLSSFTGEDAVSTIVANVPAVVFSISTTLFILWVALRFTKDEPVRRPWIAIGLAMVATSVAEVLWAYYDVSLAEVPYPGAPDVFYLAFYPIFATGIVIAIRSFRGLVPVVRATLVGFALCALATVWLYTAVLGMIFADPEMSTATKVVSAFYPLGDVWLMLFPSLVLAVMLSSMAGGRISWPWWLVVAGSAAIAVADVLFTVADWSGTYSTGSALDAGWWLGYLLLAAGASVFLDIQRPPESRARASTIAGEVVSR